MSRTFLSVVIPAYNEARRLGTTLDSIGAYLKSEDLDAEILVVDDGSTDETVEVARHGLRPGQGRVVTLPENRGKGAAVRRGVLEARGRWILMTDADLSAPIEEHRKLAATVRDRDADVAIGSRGLSDSQIEIRQAWPRQAMGKLFNRMVRVATGLRYRDTQCGFKLMDRERVRPIVERMVVDRFAFDVELLFLCDRFGLQVAEVPVVWRNSPATQVNILRDPLNMLLDVARVRWRYRRGGYFPTERREAESGAGERRA